MNRGAKPGLVLVPGLLCDALLWQAQIGALEADIKCWVADHTRSDTMAAVAGDVLRDPPFERFAFAGVFVGGELPLGNLGPAPPPGRHRAPLCQRGPARDTRR